MDGVDVDVLKLRKSENSAQYNREEMVLSTIRIEGGFFTYEWL